MKIVIDGRLWSETGPGRYIRNLVNKLHELDQQNKYFIFLLKKDYNSLSFRSNFTKVLTDFRWYTFREQINLPGLISKIKPDLAHFPMFNVPFLYNGKFVVTIHDLIHHHFQMTRATTHNLFTYRIKTLGYKKTFAHAVKNSAKIIVPSEFIKKQIVEEYGVRESKVIVTYEAAEERIISLSQRNPAGIIDQPYLFFVGNTHPHKNIPVLIRAFNLLKKRHSSLKLVLAGPETFFYQQVKKELGGEGIIFPGQVTDEELVALYKNAEAYVFPSLEEGFGIPLLEAMACSCPVVSSNAGSLPEVGGDAAVYFDPKDVSDMVEKISQVLDNNKLRQELISKGKKRYKQFSWRRMAEETLKVYQSVGVS